MHGCVSLSYIKTTIYHQIEHSCLVVIYPNSVVVISKLVNGMEDVWIIGVGADHESLCTHSISKLKFSQKIAVEYPTWTKLVVSHFQRTKFSIAGNENVTHK
jgi:hypothetical protein